jgi:nucleoside-diphosphate-sugar epimerase
LVLELTGSSSKLAFVPLPEDDPKQRKPDISKAKRLLDWEPKVDLRTGLLKTLTSMSKPVEATLGSESKS